MTGSDTESGKKVERHGSETDILHDRRIDSHIAVDKPADNSE